MIEKRSNRHLNRDDRILGEQGVGLIQVMIASLILAVLAVAMTQFMREYNQSTTNRIVRNQNLNNAKDFADYVNTRDAIGSAATVINLNTASSPLPYP